MALLQPSLLLHDSGQHGTLMLVRDVDVPRNTMQQLQLLGEGGLKCWGPALAPSHSHESTGLGWPAGPGEQHVVTRSVYPPHIREQVWPRVGRDAGRNLRQPILMCDCHFKPRGFGGLYGNSKAPHCPISSKFSRPVLCTKNTYSINILSI